MTREEALKYRYLQDNFDYEDIDEFLNKIYDDFESRVCGNCKHWTILHPTASYGICTGMNEYVYVDSMSLEPDTYFNFGCNKFEKGKQ